MDTVKDPQHSSEQDVAMEALYLISCALHGQVPESCSAPEVLFPYCKRHSVAAMTAMALEPYWASNPPENLEVVTRWKQTKDKSIRKNILLNAERQRILAYLDSIGCWYLPLKGSFLQHDYPKFGMRQMTDNDILYDTAYDRAIHDFMCDSGYAVKAFGNCDHDEYLKPPVYNFEMHRRLFSPLTHKELADYYGDIRHLMVKDADNRCGYHLSDEDFYIYLTAHAHKHFSVTGIGIRSLVDVYVFLEKHSAAMKWAYVEAELRKMGIGDYERQCRALAQKLFGTACREILLNEEEKLFLENFLGTGTFGSKKKGVENALNKMQNASGIGGLSVKLRYFWERLFPSWEWMIVWEPKLQEKPWLLPWAYIRRLLKGLFVTPLQTIQEIGYLTETKVQEKKK